MWDLFKLDLDLFRIFQWDRVHDITPVGCARRRHLDLFGHAQLSSGVSGSVGVKSMPIFGGMNGGSTVTPTWGIVASRLPGASTILYSFAAATIASSAALIAREVKSSGCVVLIVADTVIVFICLIALQSYPSPSRKRGQYIPCRSCGDGRADERKIHSETSTRSPFTLISSLVSMVQAYQIRFQMSTR